MDNMDNDERVPENLKTLINELLWVALPPECTLKEAEDIAVDLYDRILMVWERKFAKV